MRIWKRCGYCLFAVAMLCAWSRGATAQIATATLAGSVRDETGAALPGVLVTIKRASTGTTRTVTSDAAGRYRIAALDPGEYEVRAELQNFKSALRTGVVLTVGGTTETDITMAVGAVSEEVTVRSEPPLVEPARMDLSRVVTAVEIASLPISGRNFVDFVKLSSGVASGRENVGGGAFKEPDVGVGSAAAPRLSFAGQPELNTMVQVDGADNVQTFTGLPRATPSQEAAQEFRVLNSTYLAEYGRSLGGFVNIVTKSGSNRTDGSFYYFGMHDALNARSVLNTPEANRLRQNQFGATLGSPLSEGLFFFGNYEGQVREQSNRFSRVVLDNVGALNAVRTRFGLKPETTDQVQKNHYNSFMVKVDRRGASHTLSTRVNFLRSNTDNFLGGGGRASPTSSTARNNVTNDFAVVPNLVSILSPTLVNEARFQGAYRSFDFPSVLKEPALEISNFIIMGKSTSDVDYYSERRFQFSDSLTRTAGSHQLKGGVDLNFLRDVSEFHAFFPARIIFPSLAAFQTFTPAVFWWPYVKSAATYPGIDPTWTTDSPSSAWRDASRWSMNYSSYGFYVQDQWKAARRASLTYGLRYDFEMYPSGYITKRDLNNLQPRIGGSFAYSDSGVIRGGYGVFSDRLASSVGQLFHASYNSSAGSLPNARVLFPTVALIDPPFQQRTVGGPLAPVAAVTFLTTGQVPPTSSISLADTLDGAVQTPYSHQASVQLSHEVSRGVAVSAGYLFLGARQVIGHTGNLNAIQTGVLSTSKPSFVGGRRFPELGDMFVQTNTGRSNYHGMTLELERRFDGRFGVHGSYTLARVRANVDSLANLADIPEGQDIEGEMARSRQDVRQRFTLSALGQLAGRVKVGGLVSLESGRPFNIFVGRDANGDGNPNSDRPGLIGRNIYEGPAYATVDLRVSREFTVNTRARLELLLDLFNVFNRTNVKDINTVWGSIDYPNVPPPDTLGFGTPRDVFNPFQAQFAARLRF
jgi:Carboxypeptidase regulatory-like domain/TonB dependent receptor